MLHLKESMAVAKEILFIGNGINTISSGGSWEQLLKSLHAEYFDPTLSFEEIKRKPFPLVYEQIVMWQLQKKNLRIEKELKQKIAEDVLKMKQNKAHLAIASGHWSDIITANYEFNLMPAGQTQLKNQGIVRETMYSVFRHFLVDQKRFWHLHGDAQNTDSINLGYEHYCGQLQRMREYVTTAYKFGKIGKSGLFDEPLLKRKYLQSKQVYSWIDFFFRDHCTIKIIGLRLNLEELDLWWLLTYRAKIMYGAVKQFKRRPVNNTVVFYIPKEYTIDPKTKKLQQEFNDKKDLLERMNVVVKVIDVKHSEAYYLEVLKDKTGNKR